MIDCIYWRYGGGGIFRREVIILGVSDVCPCYRESVTSITKRYQVLWSVAGALPVCEYGGLMRSYSDYIKATKGYLRGYKQFRVAIENLEDDVNQKRRLLDDVHVAVAGYGEVCGGTSELTATEAAVERRGRIAEDIEHVEGEIDRIKSTLQKIDRAINGLDDIVRRLVIGHYIECHTWAELSIELYMTEKTARVKGGKAIRQMAFMLFGSEALPPDRRSVFL